MVTVVLPVLWQAVHVVPLFPEYPATPPGKAWAEMGSSITTRARRLAYKIRKETCLSRSSLYVWEGAELGADLSAGIQAEECLLFRM
jgi:hypothetical protein